MSHDDKSSLQTVFVTEHHRNEVKKHFEYLVKKYTAADFRMDTSQPVACAINDAINLACGIQEHLSATEPTEAWRSAVMLAGLTPEKVGELWKSAMFESAANFRGYLDQGRLPAFGKGGEATLPERFVIKLVDHLLSASTDGKADSNGR